MDDDHPYLEKRLGHKPYGHVQHRIRRQVPTGSNLPAQPNTELNYTLQQSTLTRLQFSLTLAIIRLLVSPLMEQAAAEPARNRFRPDFRGERLLRFSLVRSPGPIAVGADTASALRTNQEHLVVVAPAKRRWDSNAQCEQFNYSDSDHQHGECYQIVVKPISSLVHDTPPCSRFINQMCGRDSQAVNRALMPARLPRRVRTRGPQSNRPRPL